MPPLVISIFHDHAPQRRILSDYQECKTDTKASTYDTKAMCSDTQLLSIQAKSKENMRGLGGRLNLEHKVLFTRREGLQA